MHVGEKRTIYVWFPTVEKLIYAEKSVFIFDKEDDSNRHDSRLYAHTIQLWNKAPIYVKELFWKAFCRKALQNPMFRPSEKEQFVVMKRLFEEIKTSN